MWKVKKVNVKRSLKILHGARAAGTPWTEIAFALSELEASGPSDEHGRPWIQRAEEESGYSANQLRRMAKVADFLNRLIHSDPPAAELLSGRPFSHIEMISKIWLLDEQHARQLIRDTSTHRTFRDLLKIHVNLSQERGGTAPIAAGKMAAKQFRQKPLHLIKRNLEKLRPPNSSLAMEIMRPVVPFRYASPDFYIIGRDIGKVVHIDAIDCYALYGGSQNDAALRKVLLAATEASFFTRFWIVVPEGECANVFLWESGKLNLDNVGIITVTANDHLLWSRVPSAAARPIPDRRHLWTEYDVSRLRHGS